MNYSKSFSVALGVTFILAGIIGFIPNPLVYSDGLFVTNTMHNLVHIVTGAVFLSAILFPGHENTFIKVIGIGYVLVSVLGFLTSGEYLLGFIHINQADKWLHVALAIAILVAANISANLDSSNLQASN